MGFIRGLSRWLLALTISVSLGAWIVICMLLSTLLNADTVKGWVASSGIYQNVLQSAVTISTGQGAASKEDLQKALTDTFNPRYLQQQTEVALQATYDWIDGKTQNIEFAIPLKDKRAEYSANLQKILEAKFANLPMCPTRIPPATQTPTCIPQGMNAKSIAEQSSQIPESSDFLKESITPQSLTHGNANIPDFKTLPQTVSLLRTLAAALPIVIVVCAGLYVLASDSKLRALGIVGKRIFWQSLVTAVAGGALWYFGSFVDISSVQGIDPQQRAFINPLFQQILPYAGKMLTLFAGSAAAVGGLTWLIAFLIRRNQVHITPDGPSNPPKPPTTLPPAGRKPSSLQ